MKVLIAGCGGQGGSAGGHLVKEKDVEQIVCTDMDMSRAKRLADRLKGLNKRIEISTEKVDFSKPEDLARVAKGVDVVFNACFPKVNVPILKACIDVGAHYVDAASLPFVPKGTPREETMDALVDFDDKAKAAGVTAISNMGVAPGFTDCATHHIVNQLDTVDRVMLRWFDRLDATDLVATWWAKGIMEEWFGPPNSIAWDKGQVRILDLLETGEEYEFPPPVGKGRIYSATFHPELDTIPRFMPKVTGKSLNYVELKGGHQIGKWEMKDVWIEAIRRATSKSPYVEKADLLELYAKEFIQPGDFKEACDKGIVKDGVVTGAIEVTGVKAGKKVCHTLTGIVTLKEAQKHIAWTSPMSYIVGMSAAIAVLMLGRGEIKEKGVGCAWWIDPEKFLKECQRGGAIAVEKVETWL